MLAFRDGPPKVLTKFLMISNNLEKYIMKHTSVEYFWELLLQKLRTDYST